jgi:uncharacterized membrane protein
VENESGGSTMEVKDPTPERLAAFSDGVIAVIITVMVLELKPPHDASFAALRELWPTFLSYAISYVLVGVVWVNHHHLLCTSSARARRSSGPIWCFCFLCR